MKGLSEKMFFWGMYFTFIMITLICIWGVQNVNDSPKFGGNEIIVLNNN